MEKLLETIIDNNKSIIDVLLKIHFWIKFWSVLILISSILWLIIMFFMVINQPSVEYIPYNY